MTNKPRHARASNHLDASPKTCHALRMTTTPTASLAARLWPALLLIAGLVMPALLGMGWDEYSPRRNYLSELGAHGSPVQSLTRWLAFLPVGIAALGCAWVVRGRTDVRGPVSLVALGLAAGYLGAVALPCDPGCPVEGASERQALHNAFGLLEYALCVAGLLWAVLSGSGRLRGGLALIAVAGGFVMMLSSPLTGLWQRVADFGAMLWLAWSVWNAQMSHAN